MWSRMGLGMGTGWARRWVVVSPKSVVVEAWSGCAMVGASSWLAEWCGQALALWLLGELGVPPGSVRSFVADNTGATNGEDGGRASHCSWFDALRLQYTAALLQSGAAEIYVRALHNSGSRRWHQCRHRLMLGPNMACKLPGRGVFPSVSG